jgi:predicted metal-binding membrane protein
LAGTVAVAALAWAYLFYLAWDMRQDMSQGMNAGSMPRLRSRTSRGVNKLTTMSMALAEDRPSLFFTNCATPCRVLD